MNLNDDRRFNHGELGDKIRYELRYFFKKNNVEDRLVTVQEYFDTIEDDLYNDLNRYTPNQLENWMENGPISNILN